MIIKLEIVLKKGEEMNKPSKIEIYGAIKCAVYGIIIGVITVACLAVLITLAILILTLAGYNF